MLSLTLLVLNICLALCVFTVFASRFEDQSIKRGLRYRDEPRKKFGGASVVDLDEDGWPDLIFGHHGGIMELYFNLGDGYFEKADWGYYRDCHGINSIRLSTNLPGKHFIISRGGFRGNRPSPPDIFHVSPKRHISDVTLQMNSFLFNGRGRSFVPIHLRRSSYSFTDGVFSNAPSINSSYHHYAAKTVLRPSGPTFRRNRADGYNNITNDLIFVTDLQNDRRMELISYPTLKMFKHSSFDFYEITNDVFPSHVANAAKVIAIAEFDYDNDGDMDLFIGRSNVGGLVGWSAKKGISRIYPDYLLENVGTHYVDVTAKSGISQFAHTRGVTTGDFNNDGWMDMILTRYDEPDVIMYNNGDGTFSEVNAGFERKFPAKGDQVTAVDFNRDGKLDVVLSEGAWDSTTYGGEYRLMVNTGPTQNFLLVRVGNAPENSCASIHALVQVVTGNMTLTRRVGSPGTVVSNSYIESIHFGIGDVTRVDRVTVTWSDRSSESKRNIAANTEVEFGVDRL